MMVDDHSKAEQDLEGVASKNNWTLPKEVNAQQKAEQQALATEHPDSKFQEEDYCAPQPAKTCRPRLLEPGRLNQCRFSHAKTSSKIRPSACGVGTFISLPTVDAT